MQQTQQNYNMMVIGAASLFAAFTPCCGADADPIAHPSTPLLSSGNPGPCNPKLDQPDYIGEVDVAGDAVVAADVPAARNPVPGEFLVPLNRGTQGRGDGPIAALDSRTVETLLNPTPNCAAKPR